MRAISKPLALATAIVLAPAAAHATTLFNLGTASGGLMTYYNNLDKNGAGGVGSPDGVVSGYDENPANNAAYVQAHFGYSAPGYAASNTNGMGFQFDATPLPALGGASMQDIFSGASPSQFGFDLYGKAPTYDGSGGVTLPAIEFADNTDNTVANATKTTVTGDQAWAVNDYKGAGSNGPGNPATSTINSLFRGTSYEINIDNFTVTQDTDADGQTRDRFYTIDVSGKLFTDGLIHWFTVGTPDTSLASLGVRDYLFFDGQLTYDSFYGLNDWGTTSNTYTNLNLENGSDQRDFYAGNLSLYFVVPEPGTVTLLGLGLAGLGWRRRQKKGEALS